MTVQELRELLSTMPPAMRVVIGKKPVPGAYLTAVTYPLTDVKVRHGVEVILEVKSL